jgi:hypothetical protein
MAAEEGYLTAVAEVELGIGWLGDRSAMKEQELLINV